jgi:hypothetical protein
VKTPSPYSISESRSLQISWKGFEVRLAVLQFMDLKLAGKTRELKEVIS